MTVDEETYREILANFPSGIAVVTSFDGDDKPNGLTVSAFCAVSLDPPLVLVCIDKDSNTLKAIELSGGFTVNLLAAGREDIARAFATKDSEKFSTVRWERVQTREAGPVLMDDCVSFAACTLHDSIEAGDHWILVGRVEDGAINSDREPLVYGQRRFAAWHELSTDRLKHSDFEEDK
jgi:flavin reductase (DIM6/NTAB) family NADH-FMN oxidoreductase RutF